ncbi:hypothetical protein PF005_g28457 [Phytophthora fragariae]|nr:hypothetical protein PF003_g28047 [Phytophthora fragariae]KAE8920690.1 hypothetical protein PF009_g29021 [Phytophthora fragariae]KAE8967613.1 hypothetical protein PF011_g27490 [Phytophthora fragariae]KAE9065697.1 hypothetical protein PF010_g28095 [Phytophthora fragariae]KAE9066475.1 hypothetical protein PF007_g28450 [Phytophthora fragariae]
MTFGGVGMSNGLMAIISIVGAITCRRGDNKRVGGSCSVKPETRRPNYCPVRA